MRDYGIGELAMRTGVKVPTIRYYEQIGLLAAPPRTHGNQRRYDDRALERLGFIAHSRTMGFSIPAIKAMLRLQRHPEEPCADLDALVLDRLDDIDHKLERLTALRGELAGMLESHAHGTIAQCRVIEVLSDHHNCHTEH